jgi:gliding motility-associated-like protein
MRNISEKYWYFLLLGVFFILFLGNGQQSYAQANLEVQKPCIFLCSDTTAATVLRDTLPPIGTTEWEWNFGGPPPNKITKEGRVSNLFKAAQSYTITLIRTVNGVKQAPVTQIVKIDQMTNIYLGKTPEVQDTIICKGQSLQLNPFHTAVKPPISTLKYLWSPGGQRTQTIQVDSAGCYSVEVVDSLTGCYSQAKMRVEVCIVPPKPPANPNNFWYFGSNAGIKFPGNASSTGGGTPPTPNPTPTPTPTPPTPSTVDLKGKINTVEGVSGVTDAQGNLLFYTDGIKVYDKDGKLLPFLFPKTKGDTVLGGSKTSTQSAVIVPEPVCQSCDPVRYYVFTTQDINGTKKLTYSIIDVRENGGKGAIVKQNVQLTETVPSTERLITVLNPKDSTYWTISHDYNSNKFRLFRVTKSGVSEAKTFDIGSKIDSLEKGKGYIKVSPDGKQIAMVIPGGKRNYVEIFNFNDSTGVISGKPVKIDLGPAPPAAYGVEFSPNGKNLYVTLNADTAKNKDPKIRSELLYLDISSKDSIKISASKVRIDSTRANFGSIQIAPDGKLYLAIQDGSALGVITHPDSAVTASDTSKIKYKRQGFNLGGRKSQLGLPTQPKVFPPSQSGMGTQIEGEGGCEGEDLPFQVSDLCATQTSKKENLSVKWEIWRPGSGGGGGGGGNQITTSQGVRDTLGTAIYIKVKVKSSGGGLPTGGTLNQFTIDQSVVAAANLKPGIYYLSATITNACISDTIIEPIAFEIIPIPKVELGNPLKQCASSITVQSSVTNTTPTLYFWYLNKAPLQRTTTPKLTATKSGEYKVVAVNKGCINADSVQVELYKAKPLSVGADTTVCQGKSVLLDASGAGGTTSTYLWSNGSKAPQVIVNQAGKYSVVVKDAATNCESRDEVQVNIKPRVGFGTPLKKQPTDCSKNDGAINLQNITPANGTYTFKWFKDGVEIVGATTGAISNVEAGNYRVLIQGNAICDTSLAISLNPLITTFKPTINPGPIPADCNVGNNGGIRFQINGSGTSQIPAKFVLRKIGTPDVEVKKGPLSLIATTGGSYLIKDLTPGIYVVEFSDALDCKFTLEAITVGLAPKTKVKINPAVSKCEGEDILLESGLTTIPAGADLLWNTGEKTPTITIKTAGTYTVTLSESSGLCRSTDQTAVTFKPAPVVNLGGALEVCTGSVPINLVASPTGGTWTGTNVSSTGTYTPTATVGTKDVLTYTVTATNGCDGKGTKEISKKLAPSVNLGPDRDFCNNGFDSLRNLSINTALGIRYKWSSGQSSPAIFPTNSGKYTLTVSQNGCSINSSVNVNVLPVPYVSLKSIYELCLYEARPISIETGQVSGNTYSWFFNNNPIAGQTTSKISASNIGTYAVEVKNIEGCYARKKALVIDLCNPFILVPDIFTPNADAKNNFFEIFPKYKIKDFKLQIYNRWGELVFISNRMDDAWDGTFGGKPVKPDSYAWVISYVPNEPNVPEETRYLRGAVTVAW